MKLTCPMLVVDDITRSKEFYERVLNQKTVLDFGENITFSGGFSLQSKSSWTNFLHLKNTEDIKLGALNFELYFEIDNFDEVMSAIKKYDDVKLVHEPVKYPWGQRVVRIFDPDRHVIELGESMKTVILRFLDSGMSIEDTAKISQHPEEYVKWCVENR